MSPIKEKILSVIQKTVVIILACLLGLCILPVGLMPDKEPEKTGDFFRIFAEAEAYPGSTSKAKGVEEISRRSDAYLKFNIESLHETDVDDIKSVRMRFAFLKGSGEVSNKVTISLADERMWSKDGGYIKPSVFAEREIETIYPQTHSADDSLSEIDITEIVREYISQGRKMVAIRLSADMQIGACLASGEFYDSAYRPYIKVVTGDAKDTDAYTFRRAELSEAVYVSQKEPDKSGFYYAEQNENLIVGDGNEAYLKFDLNENSIFDTVYDVRLSLCQKSNFGKTNLKVYCINNNQWSGDITYAALPRGEETIATEVKAEEGGRLNIDITGAVSQARALGIKSLTLRIVGDEQPVEFYGKGDERQKPALYIRATDDKNIGCAAEAALNALGVNPASFVTMDLTNSHTAEDGTNAKIRWREYSAKGVEITGRHISADGRVERPMWFEGAAEVVAEAKIRSGDYLTVRKIYVTIPAAAAPDYSRNNFSNYIDIGNSKSEEEQKFEGAKVSGIRRRWTSGRMFSYRVPETDGAMVLNMACIPDNDNFITLKLWEGDKTAYCDFVLSVCDKERKSMVLEAPDGQIVYEKGFVYVTYRLPREFTEGKRFVSLCLSCREPHREMDRAEDYEPRGVYAAYMTQSAFFDPKAFAKQGEKSISNPYFGEGAIRKFLNNLKTLSSSGGTDTSTDTQVVTENKTQGMSLDKNNGTAVFTGAEVNVAFFVDIEGQTAEIYQKTEYYDRYCKECPIVIEDDFVIIDYGDYKMVWNMSDTDEAVLPYWQLEVSGAYKEIVSGKYYTFSEEWQLTDDSVIPEGEDVEDGRRIVIAPESAILLMHIAEPMHKSDWRVSKINGKTISELVFGENEEVENITVKAVGGVSQEAGKVSVILALYENDKIITVCQGEADVSGSVDMYTVDFSKANVYMKRGRSIRVFVADNTTEMTELAPKLEIP